MSIRVRASVVPIHHGCGIPSRPDPPTNLVLNPHGDDHDHVHGDGDGHGYGHGHGCGDHEKPLITDRELATTGRPAVFDSS